MSSVVVSGETRGVRRVSQGQESCRWHQQLRRWTECLWRILCHEWEDPVAQGRESTSLSCPREDRECGRESDQEEGRDEENRSADARMQPLHRMERTNRSSTTTRSPFPVMSFAPRSVCTCVWVSSVCVCVRLSPMLTHWYVVRAAVHPRL